MESLVSQCVALGKSPSFEDLWIQQKFDRITEKYGLSGRMETDFFISRRLGGAQPSHRLKVRYWRTRQHLPKTREQCVRLGQALELSGEEMGILLRNYYDSSDCEFRKAVPGAEQPWIRSDLDPLYHARRKFVNEALAQYLVRHRDTESQAPCVKRTPISHYARHQYCLDALNYVHCPAPLREELLGKHLVSSSFASEFSRTLTLLGNIPRKTMLRYLFLFYGADVSRSRLDAALTALGYAALDESHALPGGQRLDFLILKLLERWEAECAAGDRSHRQQRLQAHCQALDRELQRQDQQALRFLYFKGLQNFLQ